MSADPLTEVERLVTADECAILKTAIGSKTPLPASNAEECAEVLRRRRRVTVADQERWRATGKPPHQDDADLDGLLHELRNLPPP